MSSQKIHIGPNGPAPCRATVRPCEYEVSGTKEEVTRIWEKQQEALFADSMLSGVSKSAVKGKTEPETQPEIEGAVRENPNKVKATSVLSSRDKYAPSVETVQYEESEKDIAMKLALSNLTELSYTPIKEKDDEWMTNGCSDVGRYVLEDGSVGYFKSLSNNSEQEGSFKDYGTTSLGAAINEVNAYRMAQALGDEYAKMVPETVIREIDGSIGTLQREVKENRDGVNKAKAEIFKGDVRRAAIFDFIIGNQDRHNDNYLYSETEDENSRPCIRLIDNSFSFPPEGGTFNMSMFTDNDGIYTMSAKEMQFTEEDFDSLDKARATVEEWMTSNTIDQHLGDETIRRIDYLADAAEICDFSSYPRISSFW